MRGDGPLILLLGLAAALLFCLSLGIGAYGLDWGAAIADPLGAGDDAVIARELRLPRAALGALVGAALGGSGAALQGLLRNPLAEPGIVGVTAAAGLGAVIAFYYGLSADFQLAVPLAAMAGAFAATALVVVIAGRGASPVTLVLAGVAVASFAGAMTALALSLAPNPWALAEMTLWLMGSLRDRSLVDLALALPFVAAGLALLILARRGLDALTLGEETAASLGVSIGRTSLLVIAGAALAVGAATAAAGAIGFVGLVVPHLLRPFVGAEPGRLIVPSALGGAVLVLAADSLVRLASPGSELMLGVVTATLGAPFFLMLILRHRRDAQWR